MSVEGSSPHLGDVVFEYYDPNNHDVMMGYSAREVVTRSGLAPADRFAQDVFARHYAGEPMTLAEITDNLAGEVDAGRMTDADALYAARNLGIF